MNYAEILSRRLKKAGRDFAKGQAVDKKEQLQVILREIMQEGQDTGTFFPWTEAVRRLNLEEMEQLLLCASWGLCAVEGSISAESFRKLYMEIYEEEPENTASLPTWYRPADGRVVLAEVMFSFLEGKSPELPSGVKLVLPREEHSYGTESILEDGKKIFQLAEKRGGSLIFCLTGEKGSGRTFLMEQLAAEEGMTLLLMDGDRFQGGRRELNDCILCTALYDSFFCIRMGKEEREGLLQDLTDCFTFFGMIRDADRPLTERTEAAVLTRSTERPDRQLKEQMAEDVLGEIWHTLPETMKKAQIAGRQLPTGTYLQYLKNIRAEAESGMIIENTVLLPAAGTKLQLLPATRSFAELKLPVAQYQKLQQICRMISAKEQVLEQWGFGQKFSYGNGISILFYGAPGTGKTMAAQVMANELGMPLYRVDLSQLISKYIGETQKNIGRIFEEADKCDCILLFDEADAIFTKRSDVSDAQDRYSNAETAYLLQRIEQYSGVSILATNLLQNFDDAFRRRISYMVHFPMPDAALRKELWESIFPKDTPVAGEVDALMLAQAFELSGASIKNAALHGALLAASEGVPVGMKHLLGGIENEYGKQGKNFSTSQRELLEAFL